MRINITVNKETGLKVLEAMNIRVYELFKDSATFEKKVPGVGTISIKNALVRHEDGIEDSYFSVTIIMKDFIIDAIADFASMYVNLVKALVPMISSLTENLKMKIQEEIKKEEKTEEE